MNPDSKRGLLRAKNEAEESGEGEQKERRHYSRVVPREERERRDGKKTKGANLNDVLHSWSPKITLRLWLTHIPRSAEVMAHVDEVV